MIFCFSGTGNSRFVADAVSRVLGDAVVDIPRAMGGSMPAMPADERLVIVSPVYFYGPPSIVEDFIPLLAGHRGDVHAVFTYGTVTGRAGYLLSKIFTDLGLVLSSIHYVKMPENYTPIYKLQPSEEIERITLRGKKRAMEVANEIASGAKGDFVADHGPLPRLQSVVLRKLYRGARKTSKFKVSEDCNGCGACAKGCPINAIELRDGVPSWSVDRCVMCLACLHKCPMSAITRGGRTESEGRYVNPMLGGRE